MTMGSTWVAMGLAPVILQTSCSASPNNANQTQSEVNNMTFTQANKLSALKDLPTIKKMPVLFLGHGSPINAITDTEFGRGFHAVGQKLPKPTGVFPHIGCHRAHG